VIGSIVGGTLGGVLIIIILLFLYLFWKKRINRRNAPELGTAAEFTERPAENLPPISEHFSKIQEVNYGGRLSKPNENIEDSGKLRSGN